MRGHFDHVLDERHLLLAIDHFATSYGLDTPGTSILILRQQASEKL